jgi:hypothetical protein
MNSSKEKTKEVSQRLINRYAIMRHLYMQDKTLEELITDNSDIERKDIISAIGKLLNTGDIKKEKIGEAPSLKLTETEIAKDLLGFKEKVKYRYSLTEGGHRKLAYFEWKFSIHTFWKTPWSDGFNESYYSDMTQRIKDQGLPTE